MNLEKQIKNKDMRINIMQKEIERLKKENENLKNELNAQVTIPKEKYNIAIKECEKTKEEYGVDRDEYLRSAPMAEFYRFRQGEIVKIFGIAPGVEVFRAEIYGVRAAAYRRRDSGKAARRGEDDRFCHKSSFSSARFSRRNMRRKLTVSSAHDIQIVRSPARAVIHAPAPAPRAKMPITPKYVSARRSTAGFLSWKYSHSASVPLRRLPMHIVLA